jgi:hypothetical protein
MVRIETTDETCHTKTRAYLSSDDKRAIVPLRDSANPPLHLALVEDVGIGAFSAKHMIEIKRVASFRAQQHALAILSCPLNTERLRFGLECRSQSCLVQNSIFKSTIQKN